MKIFLVFILACTLVCAFEYGLKPIQVNEKVYCFFGKPEVMNKTNNGNMVNSCFLDADSSWVVIDSGPTYSYAKEAYRLMHEIKGMPVSHVINTHIHDDHWLGNDYYLAMGAKTFGSISFQDLQKDNSTPRMKKRISAEAYALTEPKLPTTLISTDKIIKVGGMHILLVNVNYKAHTDSDLFVYIPSIKTVFAGDLVFNDRLPSLRDGNINGWITVLEKIKGLKVKTIIGGHGELIDETALDMTYGYLKTMKTKVQDFLDEGYGLDEAVQKIQMKPYQDVSLYELMHKQNVSTAFCSMEWMDE